MTCATDHHAWERAWNGLGVAAPPLGEYDKLITGYTESHRAYHTQKHLEECLTQLDENREFCSHPAKPSGNTPGRNVDADARAPFVS